MSTATGAEQVAVKAAQAAKKSSGVGKTVEKVAKTATKPAPVDGVVKGTYLKDLEAMPPPDPERFRKAEAWYKAVSQAASEAEVKVVNGVVVERGGVPVRGAAEKAAKMKSPPMPPSGGGAAGAALGESVASQRFVESITATQAAKGVMKKAPPTAIPAGKGIGTAAAEATKAAEMREAGIMAARAHGVVLKEGRIYAQRAPKNAVERELMREAGIRLKNIQSQLEHLHQAGLSKTAAETYVATMNLGKKQHYLVLSAINNLKQGDTCMIIQQGENVIFQRFVRRIIDNKEVFNVVEGIIRPNGNPLVSQGTPRIIRELKEAAAGVSRGANASAGAAGSSVGAMGSGVGRGVAGGCGTYLSKPENVNRVKQIILDANKLTEGKGILSPLGNTPESAISSALYLSTNAEQGASIFRSIVHGHMFKNGNKRTAVTFWKEFMRTHNMPCVLGEEQLLKVAGKVAKGELRTITSIAAALSR